MTIWIPDLGLAAGARYLAIVDALAADVEHGRLRDGDRLPTHRDLAYRLGLTVGTVTRAYAEAERRGLVQGEVGRGTYVRRQGLKPMSFTMMEPAQAGAAPIDLSLNYPARTGDEALFAAALNKLAANAQLGSLLEYQ
ncbi:MAG: GntR family transcriptional regulator, partial [Dongiaceae bacterium]